MLALLATREGSDGELRWRVVQEEAMGRPSLLWGRTVHRDGRIESVHVGGRAVEVMRGPLTEFSAGTR